MFKKAKVIVFSLFLSGIFSNATPVLARVNVTDWYIKNFDSAITVNKDSTLDITENITADCGMAAGKHGIFRILPESVNVDGKSIKMPVILVSITDENGRPLKYQETRNTSDGTVTWKIGDPNVTVQGVNHYKIRYTVKNTIRFGNPQFDELYWNLNGNFWDLQTDSFHAAITFPSEVNSQNATVDYYAGSLGSKDKNLAVYRWSSSNVLEFDSTAMLDARQGITTSVIFPKNIFVPYRFSFWEMYGEYAYLAIPILIFFTCFFLWWKYGKDPRVDKAITPEYDAPGKLSPIELGMLMKNGMFDNKLITAEMIFFATRGWITIKETHTKILFFDTKDYELERKQNQEVENSLNDTQKIILEYIFAGGQTMQLSSLKNSFYKHISDIKKSAEKLLKDKRLIAPTGLHLAIYFRIIGAIGIWLSFVSFSHSIILGGSVMLSVLIVFIFSFLMPKRTALGADLNWEIKGFKLFMETVDKDRAAFYEKENIFDKFLPYAIVFGMTKQWIQKMQEIYGNDFYATHAPLWYVGSVSSFNMDSFAATMDSLSAQISANTSAPSGSGGGGGAGEGGGGGGGGGW